MSLSIRDDLLGRRFELVAPRAPKQFVTVVRINRTEGTVGLWWECPEQKEKRSQHVTFVQFQQLNLARA